MIRDLPLPEDPTDAEIQMDLARLEEEGEDPLAVLDEALLAGAGPRVLSETLIPFQGYPATGHPYVPPPLPGGLTQTARAYLDDPGARWTDERLARYLGMSYGMRGWPEVGAEMRLTVPLDGTPSTDPSDLEDVLVEAERIAAAHRVPADVVLDTRRRLHGLPWWTSRQTYDQGRDRVRETADDVADYATRKERQIGMGVGALLLGALALIWMSRG